MKFSSSCLKRANRSKRMSPASSPWCTRTYKTRTSFGSRTSGQAKRSTLLPSPDQKYDHLSPKPSRCLKGCQSREKSLWWVEKASKVFPTHSKPPQKERHKSLSPRAVEVWSVLGDERE